MKIIELDASDWSTIVDMYQALIDAVGGPKNAATNADGLFEYLFYPGMAAVQPPYTIRISNLDRVPTEVEKHLRKLDILVTDVRGNARDVFIEVPRYWSDYFVTSRIDDRDG